MQIVIDIPEERYKHIQEEQWLPNRLLIEKAITNGTPLDKIIEDIKAEIEKAMEDFYYDEHDFGVRAGFRFALEIIDNHISGKEQE